MLEKLQSLDERIRAARARTNLAEPMYLISEDAQVQLVLEARAHSQVYLAGSIARMNWTGDLCRLVYAHFMLSDGVPVLVDPELVGDEEQIVARSELLARARP